MRPSSSSKLNPKKRYLQVALNSTLAEASKIISQLPKSDRIIVEVGTPMIKHYGEEGIRKVRDWYAQRLYGLPAASRQRTPSLMGLITDAMAQASAAKASRVPADTELFPYIVADLKTMDRGATEVEIAASGGASAAVALGTAPTETLNAFVESCDRLGIDAMIDMMNIEFPLSVLRALKKVPRVVILHRGVDEEQYNRQKMLPLHEIRRIKGNYDIFIAIAGGDILREVQSAVFNDADIVVIWKSVYQSTAETVSLVEGFLKQIK
ncbi:MAG: orotidine 5'-phosphate decarboxylase / HUMPS family protein [Parcubacteria group bacterium]